jgi:hypothetical protein
LFAGQRVDASAFSRYLKPTFGNSQSARLAAKAFAATAGPFSAA